MFDFHDYVCLAASGGKECMVIMNNSKKDDLDTKIALFRYELIIPVLNRTYPDPIEIS